MRVPDEYAPWLNLAAALVEGGSKDGRSRWRKSRLYKLIRRVSEELAAAERRPKRALIR